VIRKPGKERSGEGHSGKPGPGRRNRKKKNQRKKIKIGGYEHSLVIYKKAP
jgi:hypothetical protein